jgi:hypothetical protein
MSHLLKIVEDWCDTNKIELSIPKTVGMHFHRKRGDEIPSIAYKGSQISFVESFKYLGVRFRPDGTFDDEVNYRIKRMKSEMNSSYYFYSNESISIEVRLQAYKSFLRPILTYCMGSIPLEKNQLEKLDIAQRVVLRNILRCRRSTSNRAIEGDTGIKSLLHYYLKSMLQTRCKFMNLCERDIRRVLISNNSPAGTKCRELQRLDRDYNIDFRPKKLLRRLNIYGNEEADLDWVHGVAGIDRIISNNWDNAAKSMISLRRLAKLKLVPGREPYLERLPAPLAKFVMQLRFDVLPVKRVTSRGVHTDRPDKCPFCMCESETPEHLFFECQDDQLEYLRCRLRECLHRDRTVSEINLIETLRVICSDDRLPKLKDPFIKYGSNVLQCIQKSNPLHHLWKIWQTRAKFLDVNPDPPAPSTALALRVCRVLDTTFFTNSFPSKCCSYTVLCNKNAQWGRSDFSDLPHMSRRCASAIS